MKRNVNKLIKYDNYYHIRRKNTVMEGRFAGRTWKLAGIAKFVLQLGQQSKTREETKICSHRWITEKKHSPTVMSFFRWAFTFSRQTCRVPVSYTHLSAGRQNGIYQCIGFLPAFDCWWSWSGTKFRICVRNYFQCHRPQDPFGTTFDHHDQSSTERNKKRDHVR